MTVKRYLQDKAAFFKKEPEDLKKLREKLKTYIAYYKDLNNPAMSIGIDPEKAKSEAESCFSGIQKLINHLDNYQKPISSTTQKKIEKLRADVREIVNQRENEYLQKESRSTPIPRKKITS